MSRLLHANVGVVDPVFPYVPNDFGFHAQGDETPFLRNLVCRIAGIDRSGYVRADSMTGTLQLEGRDDLSFELIDLEDSYRPLLAEPVDILSNTNLLFRGHIVQCPERYELSEDRNIRHIEVRCMGAGHALDRRLVFGEIPANTLYSALIQILQPSGIHSDLWGFYDFAPFPGPQVEAQRANGTTALQYVQRAVNAAGDGWTWWLDWNGNYPQLHVRDLSTDPIDAPFDATDDDGNILAVEGVDYDDSEYANRVYVRMGSEAVSTVIEQFIGGTFAEDIYALDYVPLEIISITVDGVSQTFGIKSELWDTGDDTSLEWYYQPIGYEWWSNNIWRGPEQSAVAGGDVIEVKYRAQTGTYVRADDVAEQAERASRMVYGSGIVEKILEVKDIADAAAAQEYADAMLEKLKTVPTIVRYTTFRHGLKPGQTQTITLAKHGIDGEYNISSVRFREVPETYDGSEVGIEYAIEATSGTRAVPHPLRLHEDIIDAVRGAQEAARASGGATGTQTGTGGMPVWEVPRGLVDGTNTVFTSTYLPEPIPPNGWYYVAMSGGRIMGEGTGDFTVDATIGEITYASGSQPRAGEDHLILYWRKGGGLITNPGLGARRFSGVNTDLLDWGTDSALLITGNLSLGIWAKFPTGAASGDQLIVRGMGTAGSAAFNTAYSLTPQIAGSKWDIQYGHDSGSKTPNTITFTTQLEYDKWYYIGITRNDALKSVSMWTIEEDGTVTGHGLGTYLNSTSGGGDAANGLGVGGYRGGETGAFGEGPIEADVQEHYISTGLWSQADHEAAADGTPPSSGLVLSCRVLGNDPEQDESPTGASGDVDGTTIVAGHE